MTKNKIEEEEDVLSSSDNESDIDDDESDIDDDDDNDDDDDDSYSSNDSDIDDDDDDVRSVQTTDSSCKSKVHTSKNIFKLYKKSRERIVESLHTNEKFEELEMLGIDLDNDRTFEHNISNAYAKNYLNIQEKINNDKNYCLWDNDAFDTIRKQFAHECDIILNPPCIQESIVQCPKCHSTKTMNYQIQTRSADEGSTTIIKCMNPKCGKISRSYA